MGHRAGLQRCAFAAVNIAVLLLLFSAVVAAIFTFTSLARYDMQVYAGEVGFRTTNDDGTPGDVFYGTDQNGFTGFFADPALTVGLMQNEDGTALEAYVADGFQFEQDTQITQFNQLLAMPTDKGKTSWDYTIWMIGTYQIGMFWGGGGQGGQGGQGGPWGQGGGAGGQGSFIQEGDTLAVYPVVRRFNTCTAEEQAIQGNTGNLIVFDAETDATYCFKVDGGAQAKTGTYITQNQSGDFEFSAFVNPGATVSAEGSSASALLVMDFGFGLSGVGGASITFQNNIEDDYGNVCEAIVGGCSIDGGDGAALYVQSQGDIAIDGATIEQCVATGGDGAAICVEGGGTFTVKNSTIVDCRVNKGNGAGVCVRADGAVVMENTSVQQCSAGERDVSAAGESAWGAYGKGSAIYAEAGASVTATDCTITDNTGTAIFMDKGEEGNYTQVSITGGTISRNSNYANKGNGLEDGAWGGGAVMAGNGSLVLDGVDITYNASYGAPGGAVCVIGAASSVSHKVTGCKVSYNGALSYDGSADAQIDGGGLYVYNEGDAVGLIEDCTYESNYCSGNGGAVHIISPLSIKNTNFIGNQAAMSGGAIYMAMADAQDTLVFDGGYSTENLCACQEGILGEGSATSTDPISGAALYVAGGTLNYSSHKVYGNVSGNQNYAAAIYIATSAKLVPNPDATIESGDAEGDSNVLPAWMMQCYGNVRLDGSKADIYLVENSKLYVSDYGG
jgi:predicted outer membrane repeat protein